MEIKSRIVPEWDTYFINMARMCSVRSKDPDTQVGCAIIGPDKEIRTTGYNSFPRGIRDDVIARMTRPEKYKWIEHAERNAIYNAARVGIPLKDCKIYIQWYPCTDCARGIIQSGINEIIIDDSPNNPWKNKESCARWMDDINKAVEMLTEAKVGIRKHNPAV